MTNPDYPYVNYNISSLDFLDRARKQLCFFDAGNIENLFYAALELRMGIEALVCERLEHSLSNKEASKKKDYHAAKLFNRLMKNNPSAVQAYDLIIGMKGSSTKTVFKYTPVTQKLINYYENLGELLHYKFFQNNKESWYIKESLQKHGKKSLVDYRALLDKIASELEKANGGDLL
ncbi:MAG: hypothetical protein AB1632_06930 [Nitrospirota bacterium]